MSFTCYRYISGTFFCRWSMLQQEGWPSWRPSQPVWHTATVERFRAVKLNPKGWVGKPTKKTTGSAVIMFCFQVVVSRCYFKGVVLFSLLYHPIFEKISPNVFDSSIFLGLKSSTSFCWWILPFLYWPGSIFWKHWVGVSCKLTAMGYVELMLNWCLLSIKSICVFQKRGNAELAAFSHPEDEDWEIYGDKEYLGLSFGVLNRASPDRVSTRWEIQPATCGLAWHQPAEALNAPSLLNDVIYIYIPFIFTGGFGGFCTFRMLCATESYKRPIMWRWGPLGFG